MYRLLEDEVYMKCAFDYFATLDISDFNPFSIPSTAYEKDQKSVCMPSTYQFLVDYLTNKEDKEQRYGLPTIHHYEDRLCDNGDLEFTIKDIYLRYLHYCKNESGFNPVNKSNFKTLITNLDIHETKGTKGKSSHYDNDKKRYIYISVPVIEKALQKYLKNDSFSI